MNNFDRESVLFCYSKKEHKMNGNEVQFELVLFILQFKNDGEKEKKNRIHQCQSCGFWNSIYVAYPQCYTLQIKNFGDTLVVFTIF